MSVSRDAQTRGAAVAEPPVIQAIAGAVGTPAYVYNADVLRSAYHRLDTAFGTAPHAIHYALKANSALAIVRLVRALGSAADANSMGEVEVALRCGFRPDEIVFTTSWNGRSRSTCSPSTWNRRASSIGSRTWPPTAAPSHAWPCG